MTFIMEMKIHSKMKSQNMLPFNIILILLACTSIANGMLEGLYCGQHNCYEILGVTRDTPRNEIAKAYRQLAKKHHPDRHQAGAAKEEAAEKFKEIANAYEVLKDDESRMDYDYMLDNPEEYYRHYYHYYRRKMSPKVDVRLVIAVAITVISVLQYYTAMFRWSSGMKYLASQTKYRQMALQQADEDGLLDNVKKIKKRNKEEIKAEEERIIREVLESKMDIRGGYAKPKISDVLWVQIILLPRTIYRYVVWYVSWIWRFNIKKEEYGLEEQHYVIRKLMGASQTQYEAIPDEEKDVFIERELWKKHCFKEWKAEKDEEMKRQMAESARYKSYRRYMKKHGTGRMYFDDS